MYRWLLLLLLTAFTTFATGLDLDPQRYDESEVKWLQPQGQEKSLALLKKAQRPISRGTIILVPDFGKTVETPDLTPVQRQQLTSYGLATLAISPPKWPEDSSEKGWMDAEKQLFPLLQEALNLASGLTGPKILVAEGASAALVGKALSESKLAPPQVIVLVSPYLPEEKLNDKMSGWLIKIILPYLDVVSPFDNRWVLAADKKRQQQSKSEFLPHYRHVSLPLDLSKQQGQQHLSKIIHGWIKNSGW